MDDNKQARNFRQYQVWQDAVDYATHIYKITDQMPWYEKKEFEKWYKKTHRTVAPVEIIGKPEQIGIKKQRKKH